MREGNTGPLLSKWLGGDHADAARLAKRMYAQVMIAIQHLYIKRGADDVCTKEEMFGQPVSGVLAYVYQRQKTWQRDRYIVNICDLLFFPLFTGKKAIVGTLLHETVHHFGPIDHAYGLGLWFF